MSPQKPTVIRSMNQKPQKSFSLSKISISALLTDFFCFLARRSFSVGGSGFKIIARLRQWVFCYTFKVLALIACSAALFSPGLALAQDVQPVSPPSSIGEGLAVIQQPLGLPATDIRVIIANVIKVALSLIGIIMVLLMLYAGYLWMTSGGNEEQIGTAKKIMQNAAIGLAIILAAYSIVVFVLRLLGVGTGYIPPGDINPPGTQNFHGSGGLGQIIKDHYPSRGQTDVPRNTKIIITFKKPIKPDSLISDYNKTADDPNNKVAYGDCINIGAQMDWKRDCDRLILDQNHILISRVDADGTKTPISNANAIAYYEGGKVFTVVIRPFDTLGSATENVQYEVRVGNDIRFDDGANANPRIFDTLSLGDKYYAWNFTCSTLLDNDPPYVNNVFPNNNAKSDKNTVIQIDFSEAMDPTGIQGNFQDGDSYYTLQGDSIFLQTGNSSVPVGTFSLVNGYRTLEFTPTTQCATNACGEPIFCLPVCDKQTGTCQTTGPNNVHYDTYNLLVRAGTTFSASAFEAIPFSGAMDISGNALDSNQNKHVDAVDRQLSVFPIEGSTNSQSVPDNFTWKFDVLDELDLTPPYLRQITPGLDALYISASSSWQMQFNKRMRIAPFYDGVTLEEKPTPAERGDNIPLCKVPRVTFYDNGFTSTTMDHCAFLDGRREYYFPAVTSVIEDAHFNCMYPGKGPGGAPEIAGNKKISATCDDQGNNCCAVSADQPNQSFCCNGLVSQSRQTVNDCNAYLKGTFSP